MKIIHVNLDTSNKYNGSSYEKDGLYLNTDQLGVKEYFMFCKTNNYPLFIGSYKDCGHIFEETANAEQQNGLSEDFVLKLISISVNKEKFNEVK